MGARIAFFLLTVFLCLSGCSQPVKQAESSEPVVNTVQPDIVRPRSKEQLAKSLKMMVVQCERAVRLTQQNRWDDLAGCVDLVSSGMDELGMGVLGRSSDGMSLPRSVNFLQRGLIKKDKALILEQANATLLHTAGLLGEIEPSSALDGSIFLAQCRTFQVTDLKVSQDIWKSKSTSIVKSWKVLSGKAQKVGRDQSERIDGSVARLSKAQTLDLAKVEIEKILVDEDWIEAKLTMH